MSNNKKYVRCRASCTSRFIKDKVYEVYPSMNDQLRLKAENGKESDYPLQGGLWSFEYCDGPEYNISGDGSILFTPGKWYANSSDYFAKCKIVNETRRTMNYEEYITLGKYSKSPAQTWLTHGDMREMSLDEISKYLPDGHPDKITKVVDSIPKTSHVLGKFSIGDVVVSTGEVLPYRQKGDMFVVHPESDSMLLYYKHDLSSSDTTSWRKATFEEAEAYRKGITNVSHIVKPVVIPESNNYIPNTWYITVTEGNKYELELWRWDGNRDNLKLNLGQIVGIHSRFGKCHNHRPTEEFGSQISYDTFRKEILPIERFKSLLATKHPIGSCVVVTKNNNSGLNGRLNHCYKVMGYGNGRDPIIKFSPYNSIALQSVEVRHATPEENQRYEREGKPYDITSIENVTMKYDPKTFEPVLVKKENVYAGKSLEEMLVICREMFPIGTIIKSKVDGSEHTVSRNLIIQNNRGISHSGIPYIWYEDKFHVEIVSRPFKVTPFTSNELVEPGEDASDEVLLDYCNKKYPRGTVVEGGYIVSEPLRWESHAFISYPGCPIIYNRLSHTFAKITGHASNNSAFVEPPSSMQIDENGLPTKPKIFDVDKSVHHQEPVVHSKKAKKSKLIIINK